MPLPFPLRILAIDDEPAILEILAAHLSEEGHGVSTARDGAEGLTHFRGGNWDVVLTDRLVPKMGGEELAAAIKTLNPKTPVIMVSGALDPSDGVRHPIPNVDWMIRKPFSFQQLGEA